MKKNKIVITHNGCFHTDDVFAVAIISLVEGKVEISRTRDEKVFETADYVVDVGGQYSPSRKRFDHHQKGGAGTHVNGIPYASCGLVWNAYGEKLCGGSQAAEIIEAAIAGIAVKQDRHAGGIGHELQGFQDLRPACLVVVAHAVLRGNRQAAAPDPLEACFLDNFGA